MLINDISSLDNWELEIVRRLSDDKDLNLVLLIQNGNYNINKRKNLFTNLSKFKLIPKIIFELQRKLESFLFHKIKITSEPILRFLNTIESIKLYPAKKGYLDVFSEEDSKLIASYDLDIILWHGFNIIRGEILSVPKFGIWGFHHADNNVNRGGPTGFWEIIEKHSNLGVTLQKFSPELDGGDIIDKSFYNIHWSCVRNANLVREQSITLLFKSFKNLKDNNFLPLDSLTYSGILYRNPNLTYVLKYLFNFYYNVSIKVFCRIVNDFFNVRSNCWTLFIGKGNFINKPLYKLKPISLPKDSFFADPFLFENNRKSYVFFENYSYKTKKAVISCGLISGDQVVDICDVLVKDYHLSYPYIFKENNQIFMIPETSENKRLEIYRCIKFPNEWELYSTYFENEIIADVNYYMDNNGVRWLFLSKGVNGNLNNELHIYRIDSLKMNEVREHNKNPVIINSKKARNAGPLYFHDDMLIRPSQSNSNGIYGYGLNLNKVKELSLDKYEEETLLTVKPSFHPGINAVHHLHQIKDSFIIDASFKFK